MGVEPEDEVEHRVYRPGAEMGFDVVSEDEGAWRVQGRGIELLLARHDIDNPEALSYVEQRLREIGVVAALRSAGFVPGESCESARRSSSFIRYSAPVRCRNARPDPRSPRKT